MSLLRNSALRVASWNSARLITTRTLGARLARFESTQAPKPGEKTDRPAIHERAKTEEFSIQRDWDAEIILYDNLKPKTDSPSPETWLIDVREPEEVMQGMIPSAVNIPLTVLPASLQTARETFREKFGFEKPRRDQEVIFYCRSGVRSTSACDIAKRNGYTNILNYKGSWLEWAEREGKK